MKRVMLSAAALVIVLTACATFSGKMGASKIDTLSARCLAENDALKPSTSKWYNLSTQERTKKKKEFSDYKKKRIELYQNLDTFKSLYLAHAEKDGKCVKSECKPLVKIRKEIVEGCPSTGESFPDAVSE